jgi:hypothetical protein
MKGKIWSAFIVGLISGLGIGAGAAIWLQPREPHKGVEVQRIHRDKNGATYRIEAP